MKGKNNHKVANVLIWYHLKLKVDHVFTLQIFLDFYFIDKIWLGGSAWRNHSEMLF